MPVKFRAVAMALTLAAGVPAAAQCTYTIPYVPDFDQKRQAASGVPGLPGSGGMYCVPTSALNWFAYFANRGITQPAGLAGPRNWQSNVNYNHVTNQLSFLGSLMGTDPDDGTGGNGAYNGATVYSMVLAENKLAISHFWAGAGDSISPATMRIMHELGGFVAFCYGRYTEDVPGFFTRGGGHCLTLVGQTDSCNPSISAIHYRDPASDDYNSTQSVFVTHDCDVTPTPAFFRTQGTSYTLDTRWRMHVGNSIKFMDSILCFYPRVALSPSATFPLQINIHRPFLVAGTSPPAAQTITLPAIAGAIRAVTMHPTRMSYFLTAHPAAGGVSRLYEVDPLTLSPVERMTGTDFRFMEMNRFGELYICDGSVLKQIDPRTNPPTVLNQVTLPSIPRMIAWDDSTDTIAFVTPPGATASQLVRYNRGLTALGPVAPLPAGVNPTGSIQSMAFSRSGGIFMCGDGAASILRMTQSGNVLTMLPTVTLPGGTQPTGLNIDDDDRILFASGGIIREYELDPNNRYVPATNPIFGGLPGAGRMAIPRSKTNHIPAIHEGPSFHDILNPEVFPGTPDCFANCDFSTAPPVLNVQDFSCFLNQFASGQIEANCDGSTATPFLNVQDFSCFLNAFAAGCP